MLLGNEKCPFINIRKRHVQKLKKKIETRSERMLKFHKISNGSRQYLNDGRLANADWRSGGVAKNVVAEAPLPESAPRRMRAPPVTLWRGSPGLFSRT